MGFSSGAGGGGKDPKNYSKHFKDNQNPEKTLKNTIFESHGGLLTKPWGVTTKASCGRQWTDVVFTFDFLSVRFVGFA